MPVGNAADIFGNWVNVSTGGAPKVAQICRMLLPRDFGAQRHKSDSQAGWI
jgi:hypothetical protein